MTKLLPVGVMVLICERKSAGWMCIMPLAMTAPRRQASSSSRSAHMPGTCSLTVTYRVLVAFQNWNGARATDESTTL